MMAASILMCCAKRVERKLEKPASNKTTRERPGWLIAIEPSGGLQLTKSGAEGDGTLLGLARVGIAHHSADTRLLLASIAEDGDLRVEWARQEVAIDDSLRAITPEEWKAFEDASDF